MNCEIRSNNNQRHPYPRDHDAFPPVSDFPPPIFEKFSDSEENFHNFTFSRKNSLFSSAEISDDFLFSHRPQISNFPSIFPVSVHFPPVSRKLLFPPYF